MSTHHEIHVIHLSPELLLGGTSFRRELPLREVAFGCLLNRHEAEALKMSISKRKLWEREITGDNSCSTISAMVSSP